MIIVHVAKNPLTGVWSFIKNIINQQRLDKDNIISLCVFPKNNWPITNLEEFHGINVHEKYLYKIGNYPLSYLKLVFKNGLFRHVYSLVNKYNDNNVFIHFHNSAFSGIFMPVVHNYNVTIRCCSTYHGMPGIDDRFKYRRLLQKYLHDRLVKNNVKLVSTDYQGVLNAKNILNYDSNLFHVIHNGILIQNTFKSKSESEFNNKIILGFCGTIDWNKGWQIIIQVVDLLNIHDSRFELVIAGTGPEVNAMRDLIKNKPYIHYLGFLKDTSQFYSKIDLLIIASKVEGLPMVLLESMMYCIPVVSTNVGDISHVISDSNGVLVERNADSIVSGVLKIVENYESYIQYSNNARQTVVDNFDIKEVSSKYLSL